MTLQLCEDLQQHGHIGVKVYSGVKACSGMV